LIPAVALIIVAAVCTCRVPVVAWKGIGAGDSQAMQPEFDEGEFHERYITLKTGSTIEDIGPKHDTSGPLPTPNASPPLSTTRHNMDLTHDGLQSREAGVDATQEDTAITHASQSKACPHCHQQRDSSGK
jgi:hypothetical protein